MQRTQSTKRSVKDTKRRTVALISIQASRNKKSRLRQSRHVWRCFEALGGSSDSVSSLRTCINQNMVNLLYVTHGEIRIIQSPIFDKPEKQSVSILLQPHLRPSQRLLLPGRECFSGAKGIGLRVKGSLFD